MAILYNQSSFYDPSLGIVFILKGNKLVPQAIQFSDTEKDMETKQSPRTVKPGYVQVLHERLVSTLNSFYGLGRFSVDLSLVPGDPQFGPFKLTFKSAGSPDVEFSVADLAYAFNSDPINFSDFRRTVLTALGLAGYQVN